MTSNEIVPVQTQIVPVQVSKKCPESVISPFFSCTFPSQTKSILHIHFKIISNSSYILKYTQSSFNTYLSSRYFMIFSQNNSNMGHNPYKYQIHKFIRVCSNPTLLLCNQTVNPTSKGGFHVFLVPFRVLLTLISIHLWLG